MLNPLTGICGVYLIPDDLGTVQEESHFQPLNVDFGGD
jgi:hypothetical protein